MIRNIETVQESEHFTVCTKFVRVGTNKYILQAEEMLGRLDDRPDKRQILHTRQANKNVGMCHSVSLPFDHLFNS